jgi:hypothetical protein
VGSSASYRVQVASDSNFQKLVIDSARLSDIVYTVPSGKLNDNSTYYWRVNATRGTETSRWSTSWSFQTPEGHTPTPPPGAGGTINVIATLDGSTWSGGVNYKITGRENFSGSSVPGSFTDSAVGEYALTYQLGGPPGAKLGSITPLPSQTLEAGGTITFALNFHSQSTSTITVNATLNGSTWSGQVDYGISGPFMDNDESVPKTLSGLPSGTYTLSYNYGGPAGAKLASISPSPTQNLSANGAIVFTLNFYSQPASGNITVGATLDGTPWSGPAGYTISGPFMDSASSVPQTFTGVPAGSYTITYNGGGPPGAIMTSISPQPTQRLDGGHSIVFTLNFSSQQTSGTIMVNATLDNKPWQTAMGSGPISYTIVGPKTDSDSSVPTTFDNQPAGKYTCQYNSGGPIGATFTGITSSPTQNLTPGGTIVFTLNFHEELKGTVLINATLNGQQWSGPVEYVVTGPYVESGNSVPHNLSNAPSGNYTVSYNGGGPEGGVFEGVVPPSQTLQSGGTITFTFEFKFQGVLPPPLLEN